MAQENVKKFKEAFASDAALAEKLKAKEMAYTGDTTDKEAALQAILVPVAEEAGYPFTLAELKADETEAAQKMADLSEEELEAVSGGLYNGVGICHGYGVGYFKPEDYKKKGKTHDWGYCIFIGTIR